MAKTCPHCGSNALEFEEEKSTEVCSQCGVVFKEGSFENGVGMNDSPSFGVRLSDNNSGQLNWRTLSWMSSVHGDGSSFQVKKRVNEQIERLHLPEDYVPQVLAMMKCIFFPTRNIEGLPRILTPSIAGCIYIISRRNGVLLRYRNVAEAAHCKFSSVLKCIRLISNYLDISLKTEEQTAFLDDILSQFDVKDPLVKELAYDLDKFCSETLIGAGKSKLLTNIGIVQMCIESVQGSPVNEEKLKEVCKQNVCKHLNVRTCFYGIKDELVKYGKRIPWIKKLTKRNVAKFIKEIITYYKECENPCSVDVKLEWEKKKENDKLQKEIIVQNARERVKVCQKRCCNKTPLTDSEILHKKCKLSQSIQTRVLQENTSESKASSGHTCCPHCCGDSECAVCKINGRSDFCDLKRIDLVVEYLIRKGYTDTQIMNGSPESMFCQEFYHSDVDGEREELDNEDIPDKDMHLYIKTESEIIQTEIHSNFMKVKEDKE